MDRRLNSYVTAITLAALGAMVHLGQRVPSFELDLFRGASSFLVLGLICHAYVFQYGRSAAGGTISFIPFLTALAINPHWSTAAFIAIVVGLVDALRRAKPIKAIFNAAQYCLAASCGGIVYSVLGGVSLHRDERFHPVPYLALVSTFFLLNTLAVSGVVAIATTRRWREVWRQQNLANLRYDVLASPVVYMFTLVYNRFDLAGVGFLAILLLGARQLYRTNRQLDSNNQELLQVMVAAIEMRDPYTSGHSQRVAEFSLTIAKAVGLPARQAERIRIAALLHDVGKIDERFAAILQKPGKLTPEERLTIELHPLKSEELVAMVTGLQDLLPAIRHHHERWDGTGYPDRIAGNTIPIGARIITFADTIDAMTTDRPYRPALGPDDVRSEIEKHRGHQFDPRMCDQLLQSELFLNLFSSLPKARERAASAPADASIAA